MDSLGAGMTGPFTKSFLEQIEAAAPRMGIDVKPLMLRATDNFSPAFAAANREPAQALIVQPSLPRPKAIALMLERRLPAISPAGPFAEEGGLISYSASPLWVREGASYVDKILKGAKPADLPVQQPTRFELVLNLKTAQALGLTISTDAARPRRQVIE